VNVSSVLKKNGMDEADGSRMVYAVHAQRDAESAS
jgi:hypothetical protein